MELEQYSLKGMVGRFLEAAENNTSIQTLFQEHNKMRQLGTIEVVLMTRVVHGEGAEKERQRKGSEG